MKTTQISLPVDALPKKWYNIAPDLPAPLPPPKEPESGPSRMEFLGKTMVHECLGQEASTDRWIPIPEEIRELYIQAGRPRPLYRAIRLEKHLGLKKVRLYYKREDLSPTGSHKVNTALAQAHFAAKEGKTALVTETGAGQWGSALSYAASLMGLDCVVFWVRAVYSWKTDRKTFMKLLGATVHASPSKETKIGRELLAKNSNHQGSLGIAVSEGLEHASSHEGSVYCLGSVLNHVLIHQSIIGLETIEQFKLVDNEPDLIVGCLGGGSNFGGIALPFAGEVLQGKRECEFLAAQSEAAPNLVKGEYRYDFGDVAEHTPLLKMFTLGHRVEMVPIRADGLRYHGAAPLVSALRNHNIVKAVAYAADERVCFEAARVFLQSEGWLIAPESAYAVRASIDEALKAEKAGEEKVICMNISGHGFLDIEAYRDKLGVG
ncbi:MAG: TrpB-like pyridoxal phosphate-dependent enzyme [Candidatus Bathyarchaeota archaeon]|nr:TrpB-like pyridoxal phosphate-dependent enzyme [Candidatus Bathyarchaeota archaeon]MDH5494532.1 TrpB-like pyridoxal phosphate-dependent enzyme [Candidatus Bathyarchaeota archaeon]